MALLKLWGQRYKDIKYPDLVKIVREELRYYDYYQTIVFHQQFFREAKRLKDNDGIAFLACNDRYFLLTCLLNRTDALHPWLFDRCREVERDPDGHIDLWARFHYKSTIITFAGAIQEILRDPEITISIFSVVKDIAQEFLAQIKDELENNELLKTIFRDVLFANPRAMDPDGGKPAKWGIARGLAVKRRGNPKEATIEAHGLIDGQPTGRHFKLHIYDDVVTQDYLTDDQLTKTTKRWEMADNLGTHQGVRKWVIGTRYHFADTYGVIIERGSVKPRIYPATDDGTLNGNPVFLSEENWIRIKNDQRSTVSAQLLLNPIAGNEATFSPLWLKTYDIIPNMMNVYIMCDPSKGTTQRSDRTAIAVIGIDVAGNKYLLDGVRHRMRLSERIRWLRHFKQKWESHSGVDFVKIGYEIYGQQVDLEVIEDYQLIYGDYFQLEELNTPRQGKHSKDDRIERLEPDMRAGSFYLPAMVYYRREKTDKDQHTPSQTSIWKPWDQEDSLLAKRRGTQDHPIGQIVYRPLAGLTHRQRNVSAHRIVIPLKRRNESGEVYDLTRDFIEEYLRHPFATHDDLLDATSRVYDMEPCAPVKYSHDQTGPASDDDFNPGEAGDADVLEHMIGF
jgi:phage terminase large subunit-like protein